jgi:exoribonuclease R
MHWLNTNVSMGIGTHKASHVHLLCYCSSQIDASTQEIVHVWYGRTAIRSRFAMTYQEAQAIVDNQPERLQAHRRQAGLMQMRESIVYASTSSQLSALAALFQSVIIIT